MVKKKAETLVEGKASGCHTKTAKNSTRKRPMTASEAGRLGGLAEHSCRGFECQINSQNKSKSKNSSKKSNNKSKLKSAKNR